MLHSLSLGMAHSASVSGSLLDDMLAVVSGIQCLILCNCDELILCSCDELILCSCDELLLLLILLLLLLSLGNISTYTLY